MLRRSIGWWMVAVLLSAGPGLSQAKGKRLARARKVRVAILPVQVKGLSADLGRKLGVVLIRELRDLGVFRVLPGKTTAARLNRLKRRKVFTSRCIDNPRCVRRVGKVLRAKVIYQLQVSGTEEGIRLDMRTFDVRSGKEVRQASEIASSGHGDADRVARWVTRMVSSPMITTLARGKGKLQVDCDEPDAELVLNGKSFGKRTGKSFKVSSGVFEVEVKMDGFKPFKDVVVIKPAQKKVVKVELVPEEETPPAIAAVDRDDRTPVASGTKPKDQKELPPWAVFERKKKPKALDTAKTSGGKQAGAGSGGGVMPWQKAGKQKQPYLPDEQPEEKTTTDRRGERKFYQTWWFWTLIGAGVAAGGGTAAYFLLSEDKGSAGAGSAVVVWP